MTVLVAVLTTIVTVGLLGGYSTKTAAAILGTAAGVVIAAIAAIVFGKAAGIIISALGAVMDVAMSISSAIDEIYKQNSSLTRTELFKAGLRVGRDMMGTDSNTLILAFAGSSVSTLLLDYAYDLPYQQIINSNNIGIAIMQGLAGSFGIVFSVPFTVLICTVLFHKNKQLD